jgi:hypothetical protein
MTRQVNRRVPASGGASLQKQTSAASAVASGGPTGYAAHMTDSPYLFSAADHPLREATSRLKVREAISGFGIALRYQERAPDPPQGDDTDVSPGASDNEWCETGHSIFILSGRIRYRFDSHTVEAGPGDMLHIPPGPDHRHKPSVPGPKTVRYVLTEFE